jgi:acyl-CoA synthetase (NDP forming)
MIKPVELIGQARQEGRLSLNEAESKALLSHYGVPIVTEKVVVNEEEAAAQAGVMGFPLVLKGLGARLTHKTERGLVKLNLLSVEDVRLAYQEIQSSAGSDLEGCLLQPLVKGRREFVAGLSRDSQFGLVVMFGLGGVFTEAIGDVVFRIAPLNEPQARKMIEELSSRKLLDDFRGESAVDKEALIRVLMGLSRLGIEHPDIREVDINPLLATPEGQVTAVDALVVISSTESSAQDDPSTREPTREEIEAINAALEVMVHAKSIAVVGATRPRAGGFSGMFANVTSFGFPGRLYPINPKTKEIGGYKAFPNLVSLPEPVDLVIISVPAPMVPEALKDCIASGNKNVHIFTSGFKETGEEEGNRLQAEIEKIAREGGLRVLGPNCMGIYSPESRIVTWNAASGKKGPVAFVSQSGGNAGDFTSYAANRFGIYFSKVFSYGNALTLDSTDFLEYLSDDDQTRIIAMYLEGVRNGRRLFRQVTEINPKKPVIIMKGGLSESGARAVASHTGSLAGGEKIWKAFFRQSGAVPVDSLEEMTDVTLAFLNLGESGGKRVAVIGTGGGIGVAAADSCARVGLELPALPMAVMEKLRRFIPPAGNMIRNPIDAHLVFLELDLLGKTLDLLSAGPTVDMFVIVLHLDWLSENGTENQVERMAKYLAEEARKHTHNLPLVVVWRQYQPKPELRQSRILLEKILLKAGVPVYEGLPRAFFVLSKLAEYHQFRKQAAMAGAGH